MSKLSTGTTILRINDFSEAFNKADKLAVKRSQNWKKEQTAFSFDDDSIIIIDGSKEKIMRKYNSNMPTWVSFC